MYQASCVCTAHITLIVYTGPLIYVRYISRPADTYHFDALSRFPDDDNASEVECIDRNPDFELPEWTPSPDASKTDKIIVFQEFTNQTPLLQRVNY
jgi:hypothetical protein